ncbi:MAG: hypothetical protein DDT25_00852 [Chloroflexi bacterium]|nr:hypothetical protein [Chloroflexota bacterium]
MNREVVEKLLAATSVKDLTRFLSELQRDAGKLSWLPVGNNDNNLAIINLGSDSAAGLVERVTNAIDGILDLEWTRQGSPGGVKSPRAAVSKWFDIPDGRLGEIVRDDLRHIQDLSKNVIVTLQDSDHVDLPTVDIRDRGIGLIPKDFGDTILSLNKNRKLKKLFLAGAFGQGGSTALAHSQYTVILSRRSAIGTEPAGPLGFTVVRYNPGNVDQDKHGVYEYLVDAKTRAPYFIECDDEFFPTGTLVRHVAMSLQKYAAVMTSPTGSLWWLAHNYLFDPVMPFRIEERRKAKLKDKEPANRMVTGNHRRLTQGGSDVEHRNSAHLVFRDGRIDIHWWVLSAEEEGSRDKIRNYAMVSKPIVVTYNGQKQGDFPNTVVREELKLPFLDRYLVVQVDCDGLDGESRRHLFPTTRETIRDSQIGDDLRRLIVETLLGDEKLREIDHKRKQKYMKNASSPDEAIRKRLAKRIKNSLLVGSGKDGPRVAPPEQVPHEHEEPAAIPVVDPPTFLQITSGAPRRVYAGRMFTVKFDTDARPDYFSSLDNFIAVVNPPTFGAFQGFANVRNGHGVAYFRAAEDSEVGAVAKVTLEVRPPRAASFSDSIDVESVELPQTAGKNDGEAKTPNINIHRVARDDQFFIDQKWTGKSVAEVIQNDDSTDVFISVANDRLSTLVARAQRRDNSVVEAMLSFYLEHIAFYAVLDYVTKKSSQPRVANEDGDEPAAENIALANAGETVCGIMEAMFEVLALGTASESTVA